VLVTTLLIHHPDYLCHETPFGHPERADRLRAIHKVLGHGDFAALERRLAVAADDDLLALAHQRRYVEALRAAAPTARTVHLDPDTVMSPGSLNAALLAAGGSAMAVDAVVGGEAQNAFCAVRPPGHHAERTRAMGFCLFNNVAVAARHAQAAHGLERVAIVDFDVHHGNGSQDIFQDDPSVFYGSTHQMPLYPGTGAKYETGAGNICNAPLSAGDGGARFREAMSERVLPELEAFRPDLILISAGFDAHRDDPLANLNLDEHDFVWVTSELMDIADRHAGGRIVSLLEGGYDLTALTRSTAAHVRTLMDH
jgi:acetoin utilization deacetylase AcuC-like enzyme